MKRTYNIIGKETKRRFNKVTSETTKQRIYADEEGTEKSIIEWKTWGRENGYVIEHLGQNKGFIIFSAMHNRTVKRLRKV